MGQSCMTVLKTLDLTIRIAKKDVAKSLLFYKKTTTLAEKMAEEANLIVIAADELCKLAEDSLVKASEDEAVNRKDQIEITKKINELKASQARNEALKKNLKNELENTQIECDKAEAEAKEARDKAFTLKLVSVISKGVSNLNPMKISPLNFNDNDKTDVHHDEKNKNSISKKMINEESKRKDDNTKAINDCR